MLKKLKNTLVMFFLVFLVACAATEDDSSFIILKNETSLDITGFWYTWLGPTLWGSNELEGKTLAPGKSKKFKLDSCDLTFDMVASLSEPPSPDEGLIAELNDQNIPCNAEFTFVVRE